LSVWDLVQKGSLSYDLFVRLPEQVFLKWENFPMIGSRYSDDLTDEEDLANYYYMSVTPEIKVQNDLLHPYDNPDSLKESFILKFSEKRPDDLQSIRHSNGSEFYPCECFLRYWRIFPLAIALNYSHNIESLLSPEVGIPKVHQIFSREEKLWNEDYKSSFERISYYRTAKAMLSFSNEQNPLNNAEISRLILGWSESEIEDLNNDLRKLLELWKKLESILNQPWKNKILSLLRYDIYLLAEWLCVLSDIGFEDLSRQWQYVDRKPKSWAQLKDVLALDDFKYRDSFMRYTGSYVKEAIELKVFSDPIEKYDFLSNLSGFESWAQAFHDLHKELNTSLEKISFYKYRTINYFLVFTIRSEILIRSMSKNLIETAEEDTLKNLFDKFRNLVHFNREEKEIIEFVSDKSKWSETDLYSQPKDVFKKINEIQSKKRSKKQVFIIRNILTFITARNYFAHHSYLDDKITMISNTSGQIFSACLNTLLFFAAIFSRE
jgi:hypothetical protein